MSAVFLLLPLALALGAAFVGLFLFAVRDGQMDDLDDPPLRVLLDDEAAEQGEGGRRQHHREHRGGGEDQAGRASSYQEATTDYELLP